MCVFYTREQLLCAIIDHSFLVRGIRTFPVRGFRRSSGSVRALVPLFFFAFFTDVLYICQF